MATIITNTAPAALKQLFDQQVATLEAAELASEEEIKLLFPLLEQIEAGETKTIRGRIPFIIVPQNPNLSLPVHMSKVVLSGKVGTSRLPGYWIDTLSTPSGHYLMTDVDDGRELGVLGAKPSVCLARFEQDSRRGGTVIEGITAVIYKPMILLHHYIDLPGSSRDGALVPCLCLTDNAWPMLDRRQDSAAPRFGSLSCRRRLGLPPDT